MRKKIRFIFFGGKLKAMPPKLVNDAKDLILIRPLAYCREKDIARFARSAEFPLIPCNLCGSQENAQRKQIKHMLGQWELTYPERTQNIFRSLQNVAPSHLADFNLYNFTHLETSALNSR
jgi:tRNA 2-thiocytidine biosynthesis protein TtcA